MELIEVEAFLAIVDHGTFTGAAAALGISQPAISRRIDLLEMDLETPLFIRDRTGARLTRSGEAFLPFARNVVASVRDGMAAVRESTHGDRGDIHLALVGTLANTSLLGQLRRFRAEHPAMRIRLRTANSSEVGQLVLSGEADLGLRYFPDHDPFLESTVIAHEPLVIVRAADSMLVPGDVRSAADLATVPWVSFPTSTGSSGEPFARELDHALVRLGITVTERIIIDSLTAQKRMIEADFGIGMMAESAIMEERRLGTLTVVELPSFRAQVPIVLVRRRDGFRSRAMRTLLGTLGAPID